MHKHQNHMCLCAHRLECHIVQDEALYKMLFLARGKRQIGCCEDRVTDPRLTLQHELGAPELAFGSHIRGLGTGEHLIELPFE